MSSDIRKYLLLYAQLTLFYCTKSVHKSMPTNWWIMVKTFCAKMPYYKPSNCTKCKNILFLIYFEKSLILIPSAGIWCLAQMSKPIKPIRSICFKAEGGFQGIQNLTQFTSHILLNKNHPMLTEIFAIS